MKEIKLSYEGQTLTLTKSGKAEFGDGAVFDVDIDFIKGIVTLSDVCNQTADVNIYFDELKYSTDKQELKNATDNKSPLVSFTKEYVSAQKFDVYSTITYNNVNDCMCCIGDSLYGRPELNTATVNFNYDVSKMTPQEQLALMLKVEEYSTIHIQKTKQNVIGINISLKQADGILNTGGVNITNKKTGEAWISSSKAQYTAIISNLIVKIAKKINFRVDTLWFSRPTTGVEFAPKKTPFVVQGIQKEILSGLTKLSAATYSMDEILSTIDIARYCDNIINIELLTGKYGYRIFKITHQIKAAKKQKILDTRGCESRRLNKVLSMIDSLYVDKFTTESITVDGKTETFYIADGYKNIAFTDKKILSYGDVAFTSAIVPYGYDVSLKTLKAPCDITFNSNCRTELPSDLKFAYELKNGSGDNTTYTTGWISCFYQQAIQL